MEMNKNETKVRRKKEGRKKKKKKKEKEDHLANFDISERQGVVLHSIGPRFLGNEVHQLKVNLLHRIQAKTEKVRPHPK